MLPLTSSLLPPSLNIAHLFDGQVVESERIEFKHGWNPLSVLHTMCAFANDFHNLGGGYILIGIQERNGAPIRPPRGLNPGEIDRMQKELLQLGYESMRPYYHSHDAGSARLYPAQLPERDHHQTP